MKKPRCGVPDQMGGVAKFSVRKRRYALTGQRWHHKHITYRWVRGDGDETSQRVLLLLMRNLEVVYSMSRVAAGESRSNGATWELALGVAQVQD